MKKTFLALTMLLSVLVIASSCGGKSDSAKGDGEESALTLKPSTTKVQGALGEFFEVVEKDYKVKKDGLFPELHIEVTCLKDMESLLEGGENSVSSTNENGLSIDFEVEFRDKDDNVIGKASANDASDLVSLKPGDKGSFYVFMPDEGEPTHFTVSSSIEHVEDATTNDIDIDGIPLTPKTTKVSGDLASCFEVIEGTYNLKDEIMSTTVWVDMKRTSGSLPLRSGEKLGDNYVDKEGKIMSIEWRLHIYNDKGQEVTILKNFEDTKKMNKFAESSDGTTRKVSFVTSQGNKLKNLEKGTFSVECIANHYVDGVCQYK